MMYFLFKDKGKHKNVNFEKKLLKRKICATIVLVGSEGAVAFGTRKTDEYGLCRHSSPGGTKQYRQG